MHPDRATLRLVPRSHTWTLDDGDEVRHPVSHFLDLVVDGESLLRQGLPDLVTELHRPWLEAVPAAVEVLRGRAAHPDLPAGRTSLLVCAVDGDLGCGALTAALRLTADTVSWRDLAWEDGRSSPRPALGLPETFTFDRVQYERELAQAVARVAELPFDAREHSGRPFLWPLQWGWRLPRSSDEGGREG